MSLPIDYDPKHDAYILDKPLILPKGTAAKPALQFLGDTQSGVYQAGDGQVNVASKGQPKSNMANALVFSGLEAKNSTDTTITSGSTTVLPFNGENYDTDGYHDNSTHNSRITIPVGKGGYFHVSWRLNANVDQATSGYVDTRIQKNGTDLYAIHSHDFIAGSMKITGSVQLQLNDGDYLELLVHNGTDASIAITKSDFWSPFFSIVKIG